MPIEIRELVIKATVEVNNGINSPSGNTPINVNNIDVQKLADQIAKNIEVSNER